MFAKKDIYMKAEIEISDIVVSVDNDEWYYGRRDLRTDSTKRKLITRPISENEVVSRYYANAINTLFSLVSFHEKDTAKRKKRSLYVDSGLFLKSQI